MATATTFTKTGNKASKNTSLNARVFEVETVSHDLLKQVYTAQQANARNARPRTKTRADVRGGGRKPHRQKGTGRARAGSNRSPIWRGGGITFGPRGNQHYHKHISKTAKRAALKHALTLSNQHQRVLVIESLAVDGKTKSLRQLLDKLAVSGRVVLVADDVDAPLKRSVGNLADTQVVTSAGMNAGTVLNSDWVVFTKAGLAALEQRLGEAS